MSTRKKMAQKTAFARLTRPDGHPVFVNPVHVAEVTPIVFGEHEDHSGRGNTAIVLVGSYDGMAREVMEPCEAVLKMFESLYIALITPTDGSN